MKTRLLIILISSYCLMACEGSRPWRIWNGYKNAYGEYERTGDPSWLIIMTIVLIIFGLLALWAKSRK